MIKLYVGRILFLIWYDHSTVAIYVYLFDVASECDLLELITRTHQWIRAIYYRPLTMAVVFFAMERTMITRAPIDFVSNG